MVDDNYVRRRILIVAEVGGISMCRIDWLFALLEVCSMS